MPRKLGRKNKHRTQTIRNVAQSLILYEKIQTTDAKAKEVRSLVEKSINIAKKNDLTSRRKLLSVYFHNKNIVDKLINDISPRFSKINSGYIRIVKGNNRVGDNAPTCIMILSITKFLNNIEVKNTKNSK